MVKLMISLLDATYLYKKSFCFIKMCNRKWYLSEKKDGWSNYNCLYYITMYIFYYWAFLLFNTNLFYIPSLLFFSTNWTSWCYNWQIPYTRLHSFLIKLLDYLPISNMSYINGLKVLKQAPEVQLTEWANVQKSYFKFSFYTSIAKFSFNFWLFKLRVF